MIRDISFHDGVVVLQAVGVAVAAACPKCSTLSHTVHDRYQRHPVDLPWRGVTVRLRLSVRRICCDNPNWEKITFAEDFTPILPRYARRTDDTAALLLQIALTAGGKAGARLARQVGIPTSPDTLLRLARKTPLPNTTHLRILVHNQERTWGMRRLNQTAIPQKVA